VKITRAKRKPCTSTPANFCIRPTPSWRECPVSRVCEGTRYFIYPLGLSLQTYSHLGHCFHSPVSLTQYASAPCPVSAAIYIPLKTDTVTSGGWTMYGFGISPLAIALVLSTLCCCWIVYLFHCTCFGWIFGLWLWLFYLLSLFPSSFVLLPMLVFPSLYCL